MVVSGCKVTRVMGSTADTECSIRFKGDVNNMRGMCNKPGAFA